LPQVDLPWVSVVVPCLNRANYLAATIDSILGQDYPNIECIVIDAGSTDGTLEILQSYGDRLTWRSRPDRGAFDAINEGWQMSQGEVLAWLNADDTWVLPSAVTTVINYLQVHPETDVLYGDCGGIDADGHLIWYGQAEDWDLNRAILLCNHVINQPAAFMRRRVLERVNWLYPAWCHDHDLWLRVGLAGGRFDKLHAYLANARLWSGNLHMNSDLVFNAKLSLTRRILDDPTLPASLRRQRRRIISNAYVRCFDYLPRPSQWPKAFGLAYRALVASPTNLPYVIEQAVVHIAWLFPAFRQRLQARYGHGVAIDRGRPRSN
jgi:glycosyltransferase involved in cell wall biosynthesis